MHRPAKLFATPWTVHGILQARILEWVAFPFSKRSSKLRDRTQVSHIAAEPPGKPKNTGVGSLSLLQWLCLTQESNRGLLHCRWIIYQLSYQGSPRSQRPPPKAITIFSVSSVAQLCLTFCDPMDCSTPGFPVHHQLPELVQTHVY